MFKITAEDFRNSVRKNHIKEWCSRTCSICNAPLYYTFKDDKIYYDSSCDCVQYNTEPEERSWEDLATIYLYNRDNDWGKKMLKDFNIKD